MKIEEISELIEVIALFRQGHLAPLKFRWRERVYRVASVNGSWKRNEGRGRFYHFAVKSDGPDIFELSFHDDSQNWRLERISLTGS